MLVADPRARRAGDRDGAGARPNVPDDRFRVLFDHASDAHMIVVDGGITDCNDAMIEVLGARDRRQVLALHPAVLSPERQPDGRRSDEKSREMDGTARARGWHRFEWLHQKLDGTPLPVDVTLNAVTIDGRPGLVAVWHDLTERKRLEADLRLAAEEVAAAHARMKAELDAAALVQHALLPTNVPEHPAVRFAWRYRPCVELGGDLLDVFQLDEHHVGFYVLDVTGHGVAPSLLSMAVSHALSPRAAQSAFRRAGPGGEDELVEPSEVLQRLNRDFSERGGPLQLFTICCAVLDLRTLELSYASAGHPGPLHVTRRGEARVLDLPALPVGVMAGVVYEGARVRLEPGDRLFVYSDGILEARRPDGALFGDERLAQSVRGSATLDLEACADRLLAAVLGWSAPVPPHDDISLVALEILPGRDAG
jgi:sigma-B regulation protein RsbU (phosphoserine phosphatase)